MSSIIVFLFTIMYILSYILIKKLTLKSVTTKISHTSLYNGIRIYIVESKYYAINTNYFSKKQNVTVKHDLT